MKLKKGVSLTGIQPEIMVALLMITAEVGGDFVVTSVTDSAPGRVPNSLHPFGMAVDIRIPEEEDFTYLPPRDWKERVKLLFVDTDFDVVFYDEHVHIEYDPK